MPMKVVDWLAGDRGNVINLELDWWQPNERVVGAIEVDGRGRNYDLLLRTLHTDRGTYEIGEAIPLASFENAEQTKSYLSNSKIRVATCMSSEILDIGLQLLYWQQILPKPTRLQKACIIHPEMTLMLMRILIF